jgi:DNA-binding NarL/FixJ family response regulator
LQEIAQDSGARGYVLKSEPFDVLTKAIETLCTSDGFFVPYRNN